MIVAVTGHRPNKLGYEWDGHGPVSDKIRAWLRTQLNTLQPTGCISGMALGVDQIFAELCVEMGISFLAAVPCLGQDARWPPASQKRYRELIDKAFEVVYVTDEPYHNPECMQLRNEWMVDHCDLLLAVWNGSKGGTWNCIEYATSKNKRVLRFIP